MNEELAKYAEGLRLRIKHKIGALFLNRDCDYASVIVEEFLHAAKKSVHIFCGHLGEDVYARRHVDFVDAIERGVDVKVVTCESYEKLQSRELAEYLLDLGRLRWDSRLSKTPHFIVVDGTMFRLETSQELRTAVVCAYAPEYPLNNQIAGGLESSFGTMWEKSTCPERMAEVEG